VIGPSVYIDVATGNFATDENDALREAVHEHPGRVPVVFNMWSDRAQAEALGFLNLKSRQMELLRPLKAEVRLSSLTISSKRWLGDLQNQTSKSAHFMRSIVQIGSK
jgi:hypothetical protein